MSDRSFQFPVSQIVASRLYQRLNSRIFCQHPGPPPPVLSTAQKEQRSRNAAVMNPVYRKLQGRGGVLTDKLGVGFHRLNVAQLLVDCARGIYYA